mmetsp:Transcript_754/g.2152  ORF Transcript_754/g.2152 Transcript_754/m.2152 type:complete len:231 (-) Transcript_754:180-872(-)
MSNIWCGVESHGIGVDEDFLASLTEGADDEVVGHGEIGDVARKKGSFRLASWLEVVGEAQDVTENAGGPGDGVPIGTGKGKHHGELPRVPMCVLVPRVLQPSPTYPDDVHPVSSMAAELLLLRRQDFVVVVVVQAKGRQRRDELFSSGTSRGENSRESVVGGSAPGTLDARSRVSDQRRPVREVEATRVAKAAPELVRLERVAETWKECVQRLVFECGRMELSGAAQCLR